MESMTSFGYWISRRRKSLGMTQEDLAQGAKCSVSAIRKIEADERRPSLEIAELLAGCLRVPAGEREAFLKIARGELGAHRLPAPAAQGEPGPPPCAPSNLPVPSDSLVGRDRELAELGRLLRDPHCRLLTIAGPGGMGKTRIAIETASALRDVFAGGVYFVSLAPVSLPGFIIPTIVESIGLTLDASADLATQLANHLRDRAVLLVMDNIEHLLEGAGILSDLLQHTTHLKLLATSRERLNLHGEWVFELHGLPAPPVGEDEHLEQYSAAALFLQTARRADRQFALAPGDRAHVARICQLVDGMPLGIELAATWVRTLSCREIVQEVEHDLDFLTTTLRDAPPRHRSMRAVFDHSWRLLPEDERHALRRLAVFRGAFTRDAAEQVTGATLGLLASLVSRSMLQRAGDGRFDLHELIRQYAAQKLREAGEESQVRHQHATYFLGLAQQTRLLAETPEAQAGRRRLEAEQGNLRAALVWALEPADTAGKPDADVSPDRAAIGLRMATALGRFWYLQGLWAEGRQWLERLLALPATQDMSAARGKALAELGMLLSFLGEFEGAARRLDEALHLARACGDEWNEAWTLYQSSYISLVGLDYEQTRQVASESLAIFRKLQDRWGMAVSLSRLADAVGRLGDHARATQLLEECAALFEAAEDAGGMASTFVLLGAVAMYHGDYARAGEQLQKGLNLHRQLGNREGMKWALRNLAVATRIQGQYAQAAGHYREALALSWELSSKMSLSDLLSEMAQLAINLGDYARAARIFSCAVALRESLGTPIATFRLQILTIPLHVALGERAFNSEWSQGALLSLEQAVTEATSLCDSIIGMHPPVV